MKKMMALLLAIAMMTATLAACNSETPIETPDDPNEQLQEENEMNNGTEDVVIEEPVVIPEYSETEVGAENTLFGKNEKITLNVIENSLYVTDLSTLENSENKLMDNSAFLLPKYIKVDKKRTALNWEYVSAVKYENKEVNGVFTNGLIYKFHDAEQALDLRVYCAVRPELSGPFEFYMEIDNLGEVETRITLEGGFTYFSTKVVDPAKTNIVRIASEGFIAEGHVQNADALNNPNYNNGVMYEGTGIEIFNLESSGVYLVSSERLNLWGGNGGHYLAQFIDRTTDGVFVALGWTTGRVWSRSVKDEYIETKVSLDNDVGKFATLLQPGDTFVVPSVYILPYEGNMDNGSNIFKSWFFDCKVVPALRDDESMPYSQIDLQMTPEEAVAANVDSIKWDYGWWSGYGFGIGVPLPYEGAWTLMADGLDAPNQNLEQMAAYGQQLKDLGLNFTAYVLLHENLDVNNQPTEEYGEFNYITHPEWFSNQVHPTGRLADLGNEECVEYLKEKLEKFFKNTNVSQWRTDFEPIASYSDQQNRHDANGSDVQYWCTVGFAEIVRHLYDTVEGFKFESCNSGGGSKDIYTAELAAVFNCDDTANYLSLRASFYDSSYIIHPSQLQLPCNPDTFNTEKATFWPNIPEPVVAEGDTYDFHETMLDMGFRTTIMGVSMWGSWTNTVIAEKYAEYCTMYDEKVRPLVRDGELYHILPRPDGVNWDGIMYADPDSVNEIKGAVFLFKPSAEVADIYNVVFEGLNENTVYQLTFEDRSEQNCTATGADLMTKGLDVEIKYVGSEIIWITEAE